MFGDTLLNFQLEKRDVTFPTITHISGFPIILDKQLKSEDGYYIVSGKLKLSKNDVFTPTSENDKLTFKNISVKMSLKANGNAIPSSDINFEEAVLQTKVFQFAPVEIRGLPHTKMAVSLEL